MLFVVIRNGLTALFWTFAGLKGQCLDEMSRFLKPYMQLHGVLLTNEFAPVNDAESIINHRPKDGIRNKIPNYLLNNRQGVGFEAYAIHRV